MNDFLQQLRNSKRFDKPRRNYDNPQYRSGDRSNSRDRKSMGRRKNYDAENTQAIKDLLEGIAETQRSLLKVATRQANAQERQADAVELIASQFSRTGRLASPTVSPDADLSPKTESVDTGEASRNDSNEPVGTGEDDRSAVVATIQSLLDAGKSYGEIADDLESQGIPTITGKGAWRAQTVSRVYKQAERDAAETGIR